MQKSLLTFLTLSAFLFIPNVGKANTVTVDGATGTTSKYLPVALHTTTTNANFAFHSVSQQLYYASELAAASSTRITAISFDYVGTTFTRKIAVLMNSADYDSFPLPNEGDLDDEENKTPNLVNPGTRVFSGDVNMVDGESYTITFDTPYDWNGTSNIIVTVLDSTAKKNSKTYYPDAKIYDVAVRIFETSGKVRFLHKTSKDESDYANKGWDMNNLAASKANSSSVSGRKYANKITFTFAAAVIPPATPSDLAVSATTASSATLAWSAVEGATSYDLQQSADGENWSALASGVTGTSYNWTGLSVESTQYARICAKNANGSSSWSEAVTVTTEVATDAITYKDITFNKYEETNSLPTSGGNYYLANNITLSSNKTITGDLKLCLNGHTIYTETNRIIVDGGATLTLYNNESEGLIYGGVETTLAEGGIIDVEDGGTLIIPEGRIENIADASYGSYAVLSAGTLKISGSPELIGESASIYLYGTGKVITIEEGKPLTNTTPYAVNSTGQTITSGWANMSGADPNVYFVSKKSTHKGISLNEGEVRFVLLSDLDISLNESSVDNESKLTAKLGDDVSLAITRSSLTNAQYNTICLPYSMDDDELQLRFGEGYDLEEFVSSSLDGDELSLTFNKVSSLVAGKPYLLQPSLNAPALSYLSVNIAAASPIDQTSDTYISFHGTFNPTELEGGNRNLLFLGADNELFWPESTGNIKGFRAYFEVKPSAGAAKRARIVKKEEGATGMDQITNDKLPMTNKILRNGQLLILRDNKTYNILGMEYK